MLAGMLSAETRRNTVSSDTYAVTIGPWNVLCFSITKGLSNNILKHIHSQSGQGYGERATIDGI
jgi:hypothetical protein